jgi:hypothetical protein
MRVPTVFGGFGSTTTPPWIGGAKLPGKGPSAMPTESALLATVVITPAGLSCCSTSDVSGAGKVTLVKKLRSPAQSSANGGVNVVRTVLTTPTGVTLRSPLPSLTSRSPAASVAMVPGSLKRATYSVSAASTASSAGKLNRAAAPTPSALPISRADPASVVTTPDRVILRTVRLNESDMNTLSCASAGR